MDETAPESSTALDGADGLLGQVDRLQTAVATYQYNLMQAGDGRLKAVALKGSGDLIRMLLDLRAAAEQVSRQRKAEQQERRQLRALRDVGAVINSSLDVDVVLEKVMDAIIRLTKAERGMLLRFDEQGELRVNVARNMDRMTLDSEASAEISRSIVRRVAETGEPIVTLNAQEDDRFAQMQSIVSYRLRSILCVPLRAKGKIIGVIYADNRIASGLFSDRDRDTLASFADQAAVAIENARLFREMAGMKELTDNVFASIGSGVVSIDPAGQIVLFNRAAERILDAQLAALVGRPYIDVLDVLRLPILALVDDVRAEGTTRTVELDVGAGRGTKALRLTISPLRDMEEAARGGLALVVDDVSEQKRIESLRRYLPPALVDRVRDLDAAQRPQRRYVTVLFADIRNFSAYGQLLEPEELIALANAFFEEAVSAISEQQGLVDKFIGDAVMALFNTPLNPLDDHIERAIHAALQIQANVRRLQATLPADRIIHYGIGIHSGEVVVGNVGSQLRKDYSAIGDAVNLAKRLQEIAAYDQTVISTTVYHHLASTIAAVPLPPMQIKGRLQTEQVYELRGWLGEDSAAA